MESWRRRRQQRGPAQPGPGGLPAETLPPTRERWSRESTERQGRRTRGPNSRVPGFLGSWRRRRGPGTQSPESLELGTGGAWIPGFRRRSGPGAPPGFHWEGRDGAGVAREAWSLRRRARDALPRPQGSSRERLALEVPLAEEGLTSGWRDGGGAGKGLRGSKGSRVSRASGRGLPRRGRLSGLPDRPGSAAGAGDVWRRRGPASRLPWGPGFQSPARSSLRPGRPRPGPSRRIPASEPQPPFLSPGPWSLGLQPLLPSALGGEEGGAGSTFQPPGSPRNPRVRAPRPFLSRTQASPPPLLWPQLETSPLGVKGAGPLVAMVPDCLGLLSDPWGLPRVCGEGEGGPDLGEVLRQPFPRVGPAGPGSPRLHRGPVR